MAELTKEQFLKLSPSEQSSVLDQRVTGFSAPLTKEQFQAIPDKDKQLLVGGSFNASEQPGGIRLMTEKIGDFAQRFSAAPTRAAVQSALEGGGIGGALSAYKEQFGAPSEYAPTGKDIAKKIGFTENRPKELSLIPGLNKFTAQELAGGAIDLTADTANLLPLTKLGAGAVRAVEGVGGIASKIVGGTSMAPIVEGAGGAYKGTKAFTKGLLGSLNPKFAGDYADAVAIANKFGIPEEALSDSIRFGDYSLITRLKQGKAQGIEGELFRNQHNAGLNEIRNGFDNYVASRMTGGEAPLQRQEAGDLIKDAWDKAVDNFFKERDVTYNSALRDMPETQLTEKSSNSLLETLSNLHAEAEKRLRGPGASPFEKAQSAMEIEVINSVADTLNSGGTYKDIVSQMQEIGSRAYKTSRQAAGDVPHNIKTYQKMYQSMRDSVIDTVRTVGGDAKAEALIENNRQFVDFFDNNSKIKDIILNEKLGSEQVFDQILGSGNSTKIKAIKNILADDPVTIGKLKGAWLENLKTIDKDGGFSFAGLGGSLRNENKTITTAKNLLDPEELQSIDEIVKLGEKHGSPIINPSRTEEFRTLKDIPAAAAAEAKQTGLLEALEERARKNAKKGITAPPSGMNRFTGARLQAPPLNERMLDFARQYGKDIVPGTKFFVNKTLQGVANQRTNQTPFERRLIKKERDNKGNK